MFFREEHINTPAGKYEICTDSNNIKIRTRRSDTLLKQGNVRISRDFDTIFYDNGSVYSIKITSERKNLGTRFYDKKGNLTETVLPDSLELSIFKDNIDCFYGLKNERGDTIVTPRYDRIESHDRHFFVATMGKKIVLLDLKGALLKPFSNNLTYFHTIENSYNQWKSNIVSDNFEIPNPLIDTFPRFYLYKEGDKYGVVDGQLDVVIPPQYLVVKSTLNHGELFEYEEYNADLSLKNKGFLNRLGKPIFDKKYQGLKYSGNGNFYFISLGKFPKYDRKHYNYYEKGSKKNMTHLNGHGLAMSDGTVLIEPNFYACTKTNNTKLWIASRMKYDSISNTNMIHEGIFNADTRQWILDTSGFFIHHPKTYFVIEALATKKWGIMDTLGKYIVPLEYDSIIAVDGEKGLFLLEKDHKFSI